MKILSGTELVGYIKERQAKQVRALRQSWRVVPRLAIIQTIDDAVIDMYVRLKFRYAGDIGIEVNVYKIDQSEVSALILQLNDDDLVHGIIIQLPLADKTATDELTNLVASEKDVDGLSENALFDSATPVAINWLLAGYNIDLHQKNVVIVGNGKLVGAPLAKMWAQSGISAGVVDESTNDIKTVVQNADVVVSATGVPGLITTEMIKSGATIIDAGTAAEHGEIVGDVATDVRERSDIAITPEKGGVGPLTIAALFDNVIRSARIVADERGKQDI